MVKKKTVKKSKASRPEHEKLVAALAYLLVGIIWYFADDEMKKSNFVKYHVKQGLNLMIISFAVYFVLGIFLSFLFMIPFVGWVLNSLIYAAVGITVTVLWIIGLVNAINEKKKELPLIGKFAEKYLTF